MKPLNSPERLMCGSDVVTMPAERTQPVKCQPFDPLIKRQSFSQVIWMD